MAKLSARGRTEVYRVYINRNAKEQGFSEYKMTLALMSDGVVLVKQRTKRAEPDAQATSTGWSVYGKLKQGVTPQQWLDSKLEKGWLQESK